jgi:hypothetical protein
MAAAIGVLPSIRVQIPDFARYCSADRLSAAKSSRVLAAIVGASF